MLALVRRALSQLGFLRGPLPYILAGSKSNVTVTRNSANTTGTAGVDDDEETTLRTIVIPAGTLQRNASAYLYGVFRCSNPAISKQIIVRVNGTGISTVTVSTNVATQIGIFLHADDSIAKQKGVNNGTAGFNTGAGAMLDLTFDNSAPLTITLNCKWLAAVAGESIKHEASFVWVFPDV